MILVLLLISGVIGLPSGFRNDLMINRLPTMVSIHFLPDTRMLIACRLGEVRICPFTATGEGLSVSTVYLQLTSQVWGDSERGLLSLAIDPDFATSPYIYIFYSHKQSAHNRISRFTHLGSTANVNSEVVVFKDVIDKLQLPRQATAVVASLVSTSAPLSQVITRLGTLPKVTPAMVEKFFAADIAYLQDLYRQINDVGVRKVTLWCPNCGHEFEEEVPLLGE